MTQSRTNHGPHAEQETLTMAQGPPATLESTHQLGALSGVRAPSSLQAVAAQLTADTGDSLSDLDSSESSEVPPPSSFQPSPEMIAALKALPRSALEACLERTEASVQNLQEDLADERNRGRHLRANAAVLHETIRQLVVKAKEDQPPPPTISAQVERASEAAAAFAVPLMKRAVQTVVDHVAKPLLDTATDALAGVQALDSTSTPLTVRPQSPVTLRRKTASIPERAPPAETQTREVPAVETRRSGESSHVSREGDKEETTLFHEAESPAHSDGAQETRAAAKPPLVAPAGLVTTTEGSSVETFQEVEEGDEAPAKLAVILDVSIHLDAAPYRGQCEWLQVLATDSIDECVNAFSRRVGLSAKQQAALTACLEKHEEEAESFPALLDVHLSRLKLSI